MSTIIGITDLSIILVSQYALLSLLKSSPKLFSSLSKSVHNTKIKLSTSVPQTKANDLPSAECKYNRNVFFTSNRTV